MIFLFVLQAFRYSSSVRYPEISMSMPEKHTSFSHAHSDNIPHALSVQTFLSPSFPPLPPMPRLQQVFLPSKREEGEGEKKITRQMFFPPPQDDDTRTATKSKQFVLNSLTQVHARRSALNLPQRNKTGYNRNVGGATCVFLLESAFGRAASD